MIPLQFLIIACETFENLEESLKGSFQDYKVWYLEMGPNAEVYDLKVKKRAELIASIMENHARYGRSLWKAFTLDSDYAVSIDLFDFIAKRTQTNTHFGEVPHFSDLRETLKQLKIHLEIKSIAS